MSTKRLFPFMDRGYFSGDVDTLHGISKCGYYTLNKEAGGSFTNTPGFIGNYALLVVECGNDGFTTQRICNTNESIYAVRAKSDTGWKPWLRLDNFKCNSLTELANALKPLL